MASLANDPGGRRRILFLDPDGDRKTIRLGKISRRHAEGVKLRIEDLAGAKLSGCAPSDETSRWLATIDDGLRDKLAAVGLAEPRRPKPKATLGLFLADYIGSRAKLKPNTLRNYRQTEKRLIDYFGPDKPLHDITPGDADRWREKMLAQLSPATVGREVKRAKQFFRAAVRQRLMAENPFADLAAPAQVNESREYFVTRGDAAKVLAACPDNEWRLLFALSRFGGLRCPSEHFALKWGDVDWENQRIHVTSPKTEHLPGGGSRTIPLFPELQPLLEAAFDEAQPGTEYVVTQCRDANANLRTRLERIVKRAGLKPWPRLWHNLRASRQTELAADFPLHVACEWIGNTAAIASKHYLTVTEADYQRAATPKAAQNAAQSLHAKGGTASHTKQAPIEKPLVLQGFAAQCESTQNAPIPPRGVEPLSPP